MKKEARIDVHLTEDLPLRGRCLPEGRRKEFMNRKKIIRIILAALAVAALLAAGGCALWKNGFFEKINSVEALREVIAGAGVWAGAVYFALQMMTVIIAPIPSNISMMAGALALGFWPAMILGVLAVIAGSVIVFLAARDC